MEKEEIIKLIQEQLASFMYNKQFSLSKIQNHEHNGTDSNPIQAVNVGGFLVLPADLGGVVSSKVLGDEIVIQGDSRNGYGSFNTVNKVDFPIYPIPVIMGGGNISPETLTGAVAAGATTAELTAPWANPSGVFAVAFSTGELADVTFTEGDATITWPAGLTYAATSAIEIVGDAVFKGGEAPYGSAIIFASSDSLTPVIYFRVPMEGLIEKWFGVSLDLVAPEYYNPLNAV